MDVLVTDPATGLEIGSVVRYALEGISQGLADAGASTRQFATRAAEDALATAVGISALAAEAVRQVILGTAEGMEEVARRHRAERAPAASRTRRARGGDGHAASA